MRWTETQSQKIRILINYAQRTNSANLYSNDSVCKKFADYIYWWVYIYTCYVKYICMYKCYKYIYLIQK